MRSHRVGVLPSTTDSNKNGNLKMRRGSSQSQHSHHSEDGSSTARTTKEREQKYSKKELKEWKQLFGMFDTDGSGAIGSEELKRAMKALGVGMSDEHIENIIKEVDSDGNGEIDFDEFCACMKKSQTLAKVTNDETIRECFDIFDQDRNGIITENEFKYIAKTFGEFSDELAEKLDVSSVGHLSIDQFAAIVDDYLFSDRADSQLEKFGDVTEFPEKPDKSQQKLFDELQDSQKFPGNRFPDSRTNSTIIEEMLSDLEDQ
ncbi:unnamed protein product, partial [Mesorhabditis belari]|uniref:EF-hand domain-containing protein n=1 Tax=Mesorhabditis belari TaxID=2138241 RepID=A0AAF3EDD0_9BILA